MGDSGDVTGKESINILNDPQNPKPIGQVVKPVMQFVSPQQTNLQSAQAQKPSRFGKLKKPFNKLRDFWVRLPKKKKIILAVLLGFFVVGLGILLFLIVRSGRLGGFGRDAELSFSQFGDWKKLEIPQREKPFFTLVATTVSKYGILPKETFVLKSREPVSESFVKENIDSTVPVQVKAVSSSEYQITPENGLGLDEVLSLKLDVENENYEGHNFDRDYSWAYQTQGKFRVVSSIPGDERTDVPVNTGIEIVFSQDDFENPEPFIAVSPAFDFRTEIHAETFVIVPINPLEEKTTYTVSLRKGLNLKSRNDPISEEFSFTFQTKEKEKEQQPARFNIMEDFQQISHEEPLITKVNTYGWNSDNIIRAEVYKFPSVQHFVNSRGTIDEIQSGWMRYYAEKEEISTSGMEKVLTADIKVQSRDNLEYLQLPDSLPQGFYLVKFWSEKEEVLQQLWLQSTTLTGYVSVGKEQTVVWANHFDSGPAKNAVVKVFGVGGEFRTYDNGVSVFNTPSGIFEGKKHYVEITDENQAKLVLPISSLEGDSPPGEVIKDDYWSYLYTERYLYRPGDTINFFGVVKNRNTNQAPASVIMSFGESVYGDVDKENILSKNIVPSSDGSFIGSLELVNVPRGWYELRLEVNGVELATSGISVREFEKPELKIEVSGDKKAIYTNETVNYSAKVTFFDGTPASNIPIKIIDSRKGDTTETKTGENGEVSYKYETEYQSGYSYYPRYESITISPSIAQEKIIEGYGSVYVYGSKLMIDSESEQEGDKAKLKAYVNNVDLSKINSGESNEVKAGPAKNQPVQLKVTKIWYEKKEIGTYYDFIEKVTRKSYEYTRHTEVVDEKTINTNENGELDYEFTMEEKKSYTVDSVVNDSDGHPASTSEFYYLHSGSTDYQSLARDFPQLNLDREESTYSIGEEVKLNITLGDSGYPDNDKNKFLFIIANRGKQEVVISDSPNYNFQFKKEHIPNIYVGAMIFTGKYYSAAAASCRWGWYCSSYYYFYEKTLFNGLQVSYKNMDSELDLTIDNSLSEYEPGGEASVKIRVEKDGSPIGGASVNLVLVDEALAALGVVRAPSVLSTLYKSVQSRIYYNYSSHEPVFPDGPVAEMGGGGGADRDIFKDAAFFGLGTTDENGEALFKFILPDNITTWIVYAQAVSGDVDAGQQKSNLIVTKDFFVTSNFPRDYLLKDKAFVTGGSYGEGLGTNLAINYKVLFFSGDKEIGTQEKQASVYKSVNFPFPELEVGEYDVTLRGKAGEAEDGIKLPFKVISSRLNFEYNKKHTLEEGQTLNSAGISSFLEDKPVKLIISDLGKGIYYSGLSRYCYTSSNRLEKQITKSEVSRVLKERFDDDTCEVDREALKKFQYLDGGLSQVNWGASDLKTTVWAVSVDPTPFDKDKLVEYLDKQLEDSRGGTIQKIYSSWGLTELDVPQINELKSLSESSSTYEEKIIAAFALAGAGETEKAREIYYDILADYAYEYKPYIRIQTLLEGESDMDSYLKNTAYALLLGSLVEKTYDEGLYNYLRDFATNAEDIVIDLGAISFVEEELSKLPDSDTKIYFKSGTQEVQKELNKGKNVALTLKSSEINNFTLNVLEGKAEAFFNYFVGPEGFSQLDSNDNLTIKRSYKKVKGDGSELKTGDIVEVKIDFNVDFEKSPPGGYRITDYLPSGLRYISNPGGYGLTAEGWTYEADRNIIVSTFYNSPWWQQYGKKYIRYYARAGSVGEYVGEPAVIQSFRYLDVFKSTNFENIKIEGSNL